MTIDLDDPIAVLLAVDRAMRAAGHSVAGYGGLALAAYGAARQRGLAAITAAALAPRVSGS
jgi:hypothetical protein